MAWTDYYVDLDATGGTPDGTTGAPWQSYDAAVVGLKAIWGDANADGPTRIFVRDNGTLGSSQTMDLVGSSANPIYWVGCTGSGTTWTRIGNDGSTAKPVLTCSTYQFIVTGSFQIFEGLTFSGSATATGGQVYVNAATNTTLIRCRCINAGTNAASSGLYLNAATGSAVVSCYIEGSTNTNDYVLRTTSALSVIAYCIIKGGDVAGIIHTSSGTIVGNIIYGMNTAAHGISLSGNSRVAVMNNTIYDAGTNGITMGDGYHFIANNIIVSATLTDTPINYGTGTDSHAPVIAFNAWYNCTNDYIDGIIEAQATHAGAAADTGNVIWNYGNTAPFNADPLVNSAGGDFDLIAAAACLAGPGAYENLAACLANVSHGACQRKQTASALGLTAGVLKKDEVVDDVTGTYEAAGGGGVMNHPGMTGGCNG